MKWKCRSKCEMIKDIMEVLPAHKSHIMYKCNMHYASVRYYLLIMMDNQLVIEKDERYFVSPKGKEYLEIMKQLEILWN